MIADDFNKKNKPIKWTGCCSIPEGFNLVSGIFGPVCTGINIPDCGTFSIDELKQLKKTKKYIQDMINVQGTSGNWDINEYMRGLYNGLVLAINCFGNEIEVELK